MDTMRGNDRRGREVKREYLTTIDIRDFEGTPGYALLVTAANTNLSVRAIEDFLGEHGVTRSATWIQKRRWLFQQPGTKNPTSRADLDGRDADANTIMQDNAELSLRKLVVVLKEHGIRRSVEWVRKHRVSSRSL